MDKQQRQIGWFRKELDTQFMREHVEVLNTVCSGDDESKMLANCAEQNSDKRREAERVFDLPVGSLGEPEVPW